MEELFPLEAMGCTAENIVDEMSITREDQDIFALGSHTKALNAQASGAFDNEIVSISIPQRKRIPSCFLKTKDHVLDPHWKNWFLRAAFRKGGSVTAGNSSTLNDGAAAVIVCTRQAALDHGLTPMAKIRSSVAQASIQQPWVLVCSATRLHSNAQNDCLRLGTR